MIDEEIKQEYMDYLRTVILNRLDTLEIPEPIELKILFYDVRSNLELLQSEETFNDDLKILMQYSETKRQKKV